ncbi:hypothetical protein DB88DRAFT_507546 [Papiliotrema laurentii]|uniref:Protein SET n=1 Tax=Papiliotrema laurentii TaxID=5418 RepID=A0AAD9FWP8_PAPLA|nr:hypothetical protein DB88DRAFT_507546 [Papiliotrema laurentii]
MSEGQRYTLTKPELPAQVAADLDQLNAEKKYRWLQFTVKETTKSLEQLKEKVKDIEGFWPSVLMAHPALRVALTSSSDAEALSYLTHIELKQDEADPRPYEIVFHFKENPFFSNSTLTKTFSLPSDVAPIKDGKVTKETWEYDADGLVAKGTKIQWKSDDKNLTQKQPRVGLDAAEDDDDAEDFDGDIGSFFWFFEDDADPLNIGHYLQDEVLPDAYDYFTGEAGDEDDEGSFGEFDELDEEDDEDDEGSVDLEEEDDQPKKKKQRK